MNRTRPTSAGMNGGCGSCWLEAWGGIRPFTALRSSEPGSSGRGAPKITSGRCGPATGTSSRAFTRRWPRTARPAACRSCGCSLPRVGRPNDGADHRALKKTAQAAGLVRLVDVTDAYLGLDPARLAVDADDFHPNALAHERLAKRLDAAIGALPELRPLWDPSRARDALHDSSCLKLASPHSASRWQRTRGSCRSASRRATMTIPELGPAATARIGIINALFLLALGLLPWPSDWDKVRDVIDSVRSPELNRAERDGHAAGYYEGLIGGRDGADLSRGDASQRLIGNPSGWVPFKDANVVHYLDGEFLQFELAPLVEKTLFGKPFVTNEFGMHDGPVAAQKPAGTFRIAVLGSSIDMGWGVAYQDTYINQLEQWLNAHSERLGLAPERRFEVLNFGVAAYSPMQRLETLRTKVLSFQPDLVIYAATTNDVRLMEIHLCELLRKHVDLKYDFLREVVTLAGVDQDDVRVDLDGELINKTRLKRKLHPYYWSLYDRALGAIAAECRLAGVPIVMVIVPRVGKADVPPRAWSPWRGSRRSRPGRGCRSLISRSRSTRSTSPRSRSRLATITPTRSAIAACSCPWRALLSRTRNCIDRLFTPGRKTNEE